MRAALLVCLAALALPQATAPGQLSQKDRDAAVRYLEETQKKFLQSVGGVSEAQWNYKAAPDRWSIGETAEHIALSETMILQLITDKIAKGSAAPTDGSLPPDEKIIAGVTDRSRRAQAPEFLQPTRRWTTREALVRDFSAARQKTIDYVKTTTDDLRGHAAPHPTMKVIDGYQWVLLLAAHSARHTAQIEEVKTSAGYPKN